MLGFLALLGIGAYTAVNEAQNNASMRKKYLTYADQGAYLPWSNLRGATISQDIVYDWLEDRKLFPKEYHAYFERNRKALSEYMSALRYKQEVAEGFQPTICYGSYNKYTYDPFKTFNELYADKVKIFNETGRCYY